MISTNHFIKTNIMCLFSRYLIRNTDIATLYIYIKEISSFAEIEIYLFRYLKGVGEGGSGGMCSPYQKWGDTIRF